MNNTQVDQHRYCGPGLEHFHSKYRLIHGYVSLLVCVFGSVANVLNIAVLTRREMSSPTNAILTGLAVADLLVMLEYIPFACHMYLPQRPKRERFSYGLVYVCNKIFMFKIFLIYSFLNLPLSIPS